MSQFLEFEAEESEGSEYDSESEKKHQKKPVKRRHHSDESDEEEDEADEETIRNEMKDLINDDEEEVEESDDDMKEMKKRRHQTALEDDLEDDDYALLEENLGVKVSRKKKFKRVRRLADDESDNEGANEHEDDREAIANELFDGEDDDQSSRQERDYDKEEDERYGGLSGSEESDEERDFIVDDNDVPLSRPRKKKGHRYNDEAMQQAQEIFGVEFDFDELDNFDEGDYEDEVDEEEYEEEGEESGDAQRSIKKKPKGKRKSSRKSIFEVYEPAELEKSYLNEYDKKITATDIPERFQLRRPLVTTASDAEIEEEAEWIYTNAFSSPTISIQTANLPSTLSGPRIHRNDRDPLAGRKQISSIPKIAEALKCMRCQMREVPFIAFYRKEYVLPDFGINDLWTIYHWDAKWCQLENRKTNLKKLIEDMQKYQYDQIMKDPDAPLAEGSRIISQADLERIDMVTSSEEFNDCWVQFQLYYGQEITQMKRAKLKAEREARLKSRIENDEDVDRVLMEEEEAINAKLSSLRLSKRKGAYTIFKNAGIIGLIPSFGLTPEQFGENLRDAYQKHEVKQEPVEPLELARNYICRKFPTEEKVLDAAKFMVAKQISCDPVVRKCIRQVFFERAKVHVRPTKKGIKEIDENHQCYTFKYLKNKPAQEFAGDEFLHLMAAKKEGLLNVRITVDKEDYTSEDDLMPKYFDEIKHLYQRDEFSNNVLHWNELRLQALHLALEKLLYPEFANELIFKLTRESQEGIIRACSAKIHDWLKVAPYKLDMQLVDDEDFDTREGIRVLGLACVSGDTSPSFAALIDGDGEVTDHLRLPYLMLKRNDYASQKERELREKDKEKLKRFILNRKPHVICVGAESLAVRSVILDLTQMISDLSKNEQFPVIPLELMDNELSLVFMNSKRGVAEFSDYPPILRQAISLARRLQDPLIEFSQLCTPEEEILCIKIHPLQDHVPKDDLLNAIYIQFINRVNEVGVDINRALVHPYTSQLIQFICGLGARKAAALLRNLKKQQTPLLENRTQLLFNCGIGDQVFQNCAGFIKIDTAQLSDTGTDTYIEVLDSTRIHPEAYDLARKMAIDALEYDDVNEVPSAGALEEIMENPENLKDLDLDAFADQLVKEGCGNKSTTLYDIRTELNHPYKDLREPYISPTSEQIFALLTKETPFTLHKGKLVMGRVIGISRSKPTAAQLDQACPVRCSNGFWQCPFCKVVDFTELGDVWNHFDAGSCPGQAIGVKVKLDSGLFGLIPLQCISDKKVENPAERVKPGMVIHARVTNVKVDKFFVELTSKSTDLTDKEYRWRPVKDIYYDYGQEDADIAEEEKKKKRRNKQQYVKRIIVHPSFDNIGFQQAEARLSEMKQGDAIIRPSSKGENHLTLTWKVADGINQHVDILEEGKDNPFSLGHQLFINNEGYEDLDEIIARYVNPMAAYAREILSYKYYKEGVFGNKETMEALLLEEKKKHPNKINYFISASKEFPGMFLLSYLPRKKVVHEYLKVTPNGIKYRHNNFRSLNSAITWFKEHFLDPIVRTSSTRTPINRTPQPGADSINDAIQRAAANMPPHLFNTLNQVAGTPSFSGPSFESSSYQQRSTPHPMMTTPRNYSPAPQSWKYSSMPTPNTSVPRSSRVADEWRYQMQDWFRLGNDPSTRTPLHASTPGASSQMSISPTTSPANQGDQTPLVDEYAY